MERTKRRARPNLEGLEGRALLTVSNLGRELAVTATTPTPQLDGVRRVDYTTDAGARVSITLEGAGTLAGTSVRPDGALDLVYSDTNVASRIIGKVNGGPGRARLASIRDADVPIDTATGVGAETVGVVLLPDFDLVSGGAVNLLGGVDEIRLRSVAANSQMHLRDNPLNTTVANLTADPSESGSVSGIGTLDPTSDAFGGPNVGDINGPIPFIDTVGNGQNAIGTPGLNQQAVNHGRQLSYAFRRRTGALTLTNVGGTFTPGPNLIEPRDISKPGRRVAPPGVIVQIDRIDGTPSPASTRPLSQLTSTAQLAGSALIGVQGNIQSFRARRANGLVLNDSGNLNLLSVRSLRNSSILGLPVTHVQVRQRANVTIESSPRTVIGGRNGVTINPTIRPIGPLFLP